MDRHDRLYNDYEDALFALLMDKVAQEEGARLLEENERLQNDPDAAVPEALDRRSRETIRRAFSVRRRVRHTVGWYLSRLAVAILVALLLFVTAYAAFPSLRVRTLEILIGASDVSSRLSLMSSSEYDDIVPETLLGYALPDTPISYTVVNQNETAKGGWIAYSHTDGSVIRIYINDHNDIYLDSEDADSVEKIEIHGFSGILIVKGNTIYISWYDNNNEKEIFLFTEDVDRDKALSYAEQIVFIG